MKLSKQLQLFVLFCFTHSSLLITANEIEDITFRTIIYVKSEKIATKALNEIKPVVNLRKVAALPKKSSSVAFTETISLDLTESYPPPNIETLSYFGIGLSEQQAKDVQNHKAAIVLDFALPFDKKLSGLKSANQYVFNLAKLVNGFIWDSETRQLFTITSWKEKRLDSWQNNIPIIESHITIHAYKNPENIRAISLGMVKFGLPDIVVNDYPWSSNTTMGNLINLVAQSLLEGSQPNDDNMLKIDLSKLSESSFKKKLQNSLLENATGKFEIGFKAAFWEEGDPTNNIMELRFDQQQGESIQEKQDSLLSSAFGWSDPITYVKHNQQIIEASERAKIKLPELQQAFKNFKPGEYILLKAPFATPEGGNEWMWVEVLVWNHGTITGLLNNTPFNVPELRSGSKVTISQDDVFDFIRYFPDGSQEGNETGELIMKYQSN